MRTAGRVDEVGARFMRAKASRSMKPRRLRRHAGVQGDDVGLRQQCVERDVLDAVGVVLGAELDIGVGDEDAAAEGLQQPHHPRADGAVADDADGHLGEFVPVTSAR